MMGFAGRKPILPAATESLLDSNVELDDEEPAVIEEVATDLSAKTDRTHHTLPDDGRPITITTGSRTIGKIIKANNHSQTSLLIEYFESNHPDQRPSVRVKVHPSSKTAKDNSAHILLKQGHPVTNDLTATTTRKIPLGSQSPQLAPLARDLSALGGADTVDKSAPLEIEVHNQPGPRSDLTMSPELRYAEASSDISSMPPDSMLGMQRSTLISIPARPTVPSETSLLPREDTTYNQAVTVDTAALKPPVVPHDRNVSSERLTQKVIEKLSNRPKEPMKANYATDRTRTVGTSRDAPAASGTQPTKLTAKPFRDDDSMLSSSGPSVLSNPAVYPSAKLHDQRSSRSVISSNSIQNNPKLLQTVEDAIKRLILPQLNELKKDQRHASHRSKYDRDYSDLSASSVSLEKTTRRVSLGSKSKRRSAKEGEESGSRRRKSSHRDSYDYDSLSDTASRKQSVSSVSGDHKQRRKHRDHQNRDLATTVLEHKQSEESLDRRRRRRRSKSRSSRSASVADSDEAFVKHKVPPMPMQSEIGSELTRSSILSSNTTGSYAPMSHELREVAQGTQGLLPSTPLTPTRQSENVQNTLGMHHGNFSEHNLSAGKFAHERSDHGETPSPETARYQFDDEPLEDPERMRQYERNLHTQHPIRRGLSPIQSVASYATTAEPYRNSMMHPKSVDSFASTRRAQEALRKEVSLNSFTSASPDLKTKHRPHGMTLENRGEIMGQHDFSPLVSPEIRSRGVSHDFSRDSVDLYRDSYVTENRHSYATDDRTLDSRQQSELTDDTSDVVYVDKVTAGQTVKGGSTNSAYISTPLGVESAVASLVDPSVLSVQDSSLSGSPGHQNRSLQSLNRSNDDKRKGSPLKEQVYRDTEASVHNRKVLDQLQSSLHEQEMSAHSSPGLVKQRVDALGDTNLVHRHVQNQSQSSLGHQRFVNPSPPQSPALSFEQEQVKYDEYALYRNSSHSNLVHDEELKESPKSEIITNPSIIQGPIGGHNAGHVDPWMQNTLTPPPAVQKSINLDRNFSSGAIDLIPEGLNVSQRNTYQAKPNTYVIGQPNAVAATSPGMKHDEGYATGDNLPSPFPPTKVNRDITAYDMHENSANMQATEDPFTITDKKGQYMSGLSQGMSPIYDSATGRGIDRIESKDIIALMDHLTVRDAQRNARDTEILVTLVRSAADMRNSFEEMKAYIAEQNELNMNTADDQHAHTQKVIGGPRSVPARAPLARNTSSQDDMPTKRQNVFKRALANLGSKNTAELQNIESMLMQLLDEVEALRAQTGAQPLAVQAPGAMHANQGLTQDRGFSESAYEAQHRAIVAASAPVQSGSTQQKQYSAARPVAQNRVSTVMEQDEDYDHQGEQYHDDGQTTPRAVSPISDDEEDYRAHTQGKSAPLSTPPRPYAQQTATRSNENTPYNTARESSDTPKHKSFASSLLPKMVSRWSKTTASTEPTSTPYRGSAQTQAHAKNNRQSYTSPTADTDQHDQYEHGVDDRIYSAGSLQDGQYYHNDQNRPPSPLVPSAVSNAEPKYHGHRDSQNIISPQPRQGPTGRYQFHLENAAQTYDPLSPMSQRSDMWQQQDLTQHLPPTAARGDTSTFRMNAPPSPIPDASYSPTPSEHSRTNLTRRNARKVMNEEPLVPRRENKLMSPTNYVDEVRAARAGSPAFDKSPISAVKQQGTPGRKPSGPRPLSRSSDHALEKRARFANSPIHSEDGY